MSKINVRIEDYNKLDLVACARLTVHDTTFDARTAHIKDLALAQEKQKEALGYVNDSRALVEVGRLNTVYESLVVLAHEAECVAEMRNHTTLKGLQDKIQKISFGFAKAFGELNALIKAKEKEKAI